LLKKALGVRGKMKGLSQFQSIFAYQSTKMEFKSFISGFENLPKQIQRQLVVYIEFLKSKYSASKKVPGEGDTFSFSWENGLMDLKKEYSGVELQHKINDLR